MFLLLNLLAALTLIFAFEFSRRTKTNKNYHLLVGVLDLVVILLLYFIKKSIEENPFSSYFQYSSQYMAISKYINIALIILSALSFLLFILRTIIKEKKPEV